MIRKSLFIFLLLTIQLIWIIPTHTGMFTPPSPSFSFVHSPHLHIYPTGTYTKVDEVTHSTLTDTTIIENTKWEPSEPSSNVVVASRAVIKGFGRWKASVSGNHQGDSKSDGNLWADFGSVGTIGPLPTWRNVENFICLAGVYWTLDKSFTATPKSISGSGMLSFQQKVWEPSGGDWVVISGGSWDSGETENFPVPGPEANKTASGSYTTKHEQRILCVRHDASSNPCKTYVMADSGEHNVLCDLCQTSYWNCPSLSGSHTCGSPSPPSASTPPPTDNTPDCSSCTDGCSSCPSPSAPIWATCGVCNSRYDAASEASEHEWFWPPCRMHGNYKCQIEGDHSLQATCSASNEWAHPCTVTNFYACDDHTHDF